MHFYHFWVLLSYKPRCDGSEQLSKRQACGPLHPHCCWSSAAKKWKIHRIQYTDMKLNLQKKGSTIVSCLGNSLEWVFRDCYDGCFLRNAEARGGVLLGLSLISPLPPELQNTNWTVATDYTFLLPACCKCVWNRVHSDPLSSLHEIPLPTLTTVCVHALGWLSQLRWCRIRAWFRQLTPWRGWSLRHLSLAFPWEPRLPPVIVHHLYRPGNCTSHRSSEVSSRVLVLALNKWETAKGN